MFGFLRRAGRTLTRSTQELADDHLAAATDRLGCSPIAKVVDRTAVEVSGELRSLTLPPTGRVPALIAELYDGTGALTLVWLGRREILGVHVGTRMRVRGRVAYRRGIPTIFNPSYELLPRDAGAAGGHGA